MPLPREFEEQKPEVSAPPSWESTPWQPEERSAAQPESEPEMKVALADQNEHVVDLPPSL